MARLPALQYVRAGLSQGLSANAALRQYRHDAHQEGLTGMRRQDFLRLYGQVRRLRATTQEAMLHPKDALPNPSMIVPRDTVRARGYGSWVMIAQRSVGGQDFFSTPFLVKSSRPMTPAEAEARALSYLEQEPDEYNRVTLGVAYTGTERFTPIE